MDQIQGFLLFTYLKNLYDLSEKLYAEFELTEPNQNMDRIKEIHWKLNKLVRRLDIAYNIADEGGS